MCPGKCSSLKNCVLCQAFNEGEKKICDKCPKLNIQLVDQTTEQCVVPVDDNSFLIFRYEIDQFAKNEIIYVQRKKRKIIIIKGDNIFDG